MNFSKSIWATVALSMMVAAPAAAAQPMSPTETRAQMQQWCADAAQRTDDAGRAWHAANCGPRAVRSGPALMSAAPAAALFGLGVVVFAIFARN